MPVPMIMFVAAAAAVNPTHVEQCRSTISKRLGEIGAFTPNVERMGVRGATVTGLVDSLTKPSPAGPGAMTPMHLIVTRYSFRCQLRAGKAPHVTLRRQQS